MNSVNPLNVKGNPKTTFVVNVKGLFNKPFTGEANGTSIDRTWKKSARSSPSDTFIVVFIN